MVTNICFVWTLLYYFSLHVDVNLKLQTAYMSREVLSDFASIDCYVTFLLCSRCRTMSYRWGKIQSLRWHTASKTTAYEIGTNSAGFILQISKRAVHSTACPGILVTLASLWLLSWQHENCKPNNRYSSDEILESPICVMMSVLLLQRRSGIGWSWSLSWPIKRSHEHPYLTRCSRSLPNNTAAYVSQLANDQEVHKAIFAASWQPSLK